MLFSGLKDAVVLVTGAGKGIGEAIVETILEEKASFSGLKLFITSRTEGDLKRLEGLAKSAKVPCSFLASDLALHPLAALQACIREYGRIDAFIHSAGVGRFGNFHELTQDDFTYVMKTNTEAFFILMQAVYAQMKSQPKNQSLLRGQVQCVTSIAAVQAFEQSAIYCMSKYAQRGLLDVMKLHGRRDHIRILEVRPGATLTPMWGNVPSDQAQKMMNPQDIARPMVEALLLGAQASLEEITLRPTTGDL